MTTTALKWTYTFEVTVTSKTEEELEKIEEPTGEFVMRLDPLEEGMTRKLVRAAKKAVDFEMDHLTAEVTFKVNGVPT